MMIIYKTTNKINGKIYIGKDSKNVNCYLGSGLVLKHAIKKYGKENFQKEIIEYCTSLDMLAEREQYWIKFFNSTNPDIGYNLAEGGQGGNLQKFKGPHPNKGKTYMELYGEERAKQLIEQKSAMWTGDKNPMFGKTLSDEHLNKLIESNTGKKREFTQEHRDNLRISRLGKTASDETKLKMSLSHTGLFAHGLTVKQLDDHGHIINEFASIEAAARFFNVHKNKIRRNAIKGINLKIIRDGERYQRNRTI